MQDPEKAQKAPPDKGADQPKKWKTPDTLVILFALALVAMLASYVVPAGYFEKKIETGEQAKSIQLDSFKILKDEAGEPVYQRVGFFVGEANGGDSLIKHFPASAESDIGLSNFAFEGLVSGNKYGSAVGVVAFILIIGGAFGIIQATGAIELGILRIIQSVNGREHFCIPVLFTLFSLGGAIFGMGVEAIAFALILVPSFIRMGYDSITAVMTTYVASQIGFATSWMNPFSVAIAQGIAEVPVLSGAGFRVILWTVFTLFGIIFTVRHALRVKAHPETSPTFLRDRENWSAASKSNAAQVNFLLGHKAVLTVFLLGIVWVTYGVIAHAYYIPEIATQFFVIGLACGLAGIVFRVPGMSVNQTAEAFTRGVSGIVPAALIVGLAKGIVLLLGGSDPHVPSLLNTTLYSFASILSHLPNLVGAWSMYAFQSIFNLFITSGSGQAALTMPLMAPLADLLGLTRQLAVLAFQLGDGLTNLIVPTSAALMGTLAVAKIDWFTWFKFQIKFQIGLIALALSFMSAAFWIQF